VGLPRTKSIYLPLLKVIDDAGGRLSADEAVKRVEVYFPEFTEADKLERVPSGDKRWDSRVHRVRRYLVEEGYLDKEAPKGIWQITQKGKQYLESKWPNWKPEYSPSSDNDTAGEKKAIICQKVMEIIEAHPEGIRHGDLVAKIHDALPQLNPNIVSGLIYDLNRICPDLIYKPARGVYRHVSFREEEEQELSKEEGTVEKPGIHETVPMKEEDFYKPFADWLVNAVEECTRAIPLGGNRFRDKWGTPDVIGKRESRMSDIVKMPTEIISAEIKTDSKNLITAFGQACSYKLFSHKSYIVVPKDSGQEDLSRLDALCLIFGIGLVLFDNQNPEEPGFDIRVRPLKHEPDMFYVNKYMKLVERELWR